MRMRVMLPAAALIASLGGGVGTLYEGAKRR